MMIFLWFAYDVIDAKWPVRACPASLSGMFVVYCLHLIPLCWVGGLLRMVLGTGPGARLAAYFALWLTFWIDVWIVNAMRRRHPKAYLLLSGGR